jgi:hypothetical protein
MVQKEGGTATLNTVNVGDYNVTTITGGSCAVEVSLSGVADDNKPVQIIDIKPEVPSMIVDGGVWYADPANGGDGSGFVGGWNTVKYGLPAGTSDTEVTCLSPLKAPTNWKVERIHKDDNKLDLSHATPDDSSQVWVANDNQAGTDFFVQGGKYIDQPLLTSDVQLQSSEFSTTPEGVDGLKEIIWNLNGVDQPGTTLNPYKPSGLAINTTYNVKVKHVGVALKEPSEWSATTVFTTGASRSLKEHYVRQIRELRIALAEAAEPRALSADEESPRKRARNADGTFKGDDPSTPDLNEAWEDS